MKCFVTGATGFLGSHVARQLLARGAELRLLVRPTSRLDNIADLAADHVTGDLRDPDSLKQGMEGCEFVFHVAADYRLWSLNHQELYDSNVEGTRNILRTARDCGVRRVIYTSSVATMGFGNNGRLTDEKSPVTLANMIGDYKRSKFMAEQWVLEAGRSGQNVVMVNPTTPVGERDIKPTPSGQIILDFLRRKFPAYVDTGLNLVDVVDCAEGHLLAMEKALARRALHPRRREPDAEADPRQAGLRSRGYRRRRSSCRTRWRWRQAWSIRWSPGRFASASRA